MSWDSLFDDSVAANLLFFSACAAVADFAELLDPLKCSWKTFSGEDRRRLFAVMSCRHFGVEELDVLDIVIAQEEDRLRFLPSLSGEECIRVEQRLLAAVECWRHVLSLPGAKELVSDIADGSKAVPFDAYIQAVSQVGVLAGVDMLLSAVFDEGVPLEFVVDCLEPSEKDIELHSQKL